MYKYTVYMCASVLLLIGAVAAGCASSERSSAGSSVGGPSAPSGSCGLGLPSGATPEEAIYAVVSAESKNVVSQQIGPLMRLWAEDAEITDAQHTPGDASDDRTWKGQDAIRYRYVRDVFPSAPGTAQPLELQTQVSGDRAVVTGTTGIGAEISPSGDLWELAKDGDCWVIKRLIYNREP